VTSIGPVSAVDVLRAQRKEAPFRALAELPPMLTTHVTFTERDLQAHRAPAPPLPAPPVISLQERLDLSRPIANTTALITVAMTASLPEPAVTVRSYVQAEVRAYT
jgi:hypothetical protein